MRSQTWTPLPPPSPQHLSGSSPCTCPKQAAPYVRHGLAIQFLHDSIHVRIPILPNHPTLSLSHRIQKTVLYSCVSFLFFLRFVPYFYFFSFKVFIEFFTTFLVFFLLFKIFFLFFYFTILYWFCHTLTWIHHWCTCVKYFLNVFQLWW